MHGAGTNHKRLLFKLLNNCLFLPPALSFYSPDRDIIVSANALSYGLGGVLVQKQPHNVWKPVAYASRVLTSAKQKYVQIEKEALAVTYLYVSNFNDYLLRAKALLFIFIPTINHWFPS